MPNPKDPVKLLLYRQKMKEIALSRNYGKWMKGKKASPKTISRMSAVQSVIGTSSKERKRRSERAKQKGYGKWMKGRVACEAVRVAARKRKGKTFEEIYGEDRAKALKERIKNSNRARWVDKKKNDQRPKHNGDFHYIEWRQAVFKRDGFKCCQCGSGGFLHAHHIKTWAKHPESRYEVLNGLTLCVPCHKKVHAKA